MFKPYLLAFPGFYNFMSGLVAKLTWALWANIVNLIWDLLPENGIVRRALNGLGVAIEYVLGAQWVEQGARGALMTWRFVSRWFQGWFRGPHPQQGAAAEVELGPVVHPPPAVGAEPAEQVEQECIPVEVVESPGGRGSAPLSSSCPPEEGEERAERTPHTSTQEEGDGGWWTPRPPHTRTQEEEWSTPRSQQSPRLRGTSSPTFFQLPMIPPAPSSCVRIPQPTNPAEKEEFRLFQRILKRVLTITTWLGRRADGVTAEPT